MAARALAANNAGGIVNLAGDNTIAGHIALTNGGGGNGRIQVNSGTAPHADRPH